MTRLFLVGGVTPHDDHAVNDRPATVNAAAVLLYLAAAATLLLTVLFGLVAFGAIPAEASQAGGANPLTGLLGAEGLDASLLALLGGIAAVATGVQVFLGYQLQRRRRWARPASIGFAALWIGAECIGSLGLSETPNLCSVAYEIAIIVLLNTRTAKSFFAAPPAQT